MCSPCGKLRRPHPLAQAGDQLSPTDAVPDRLARRLHARDAVIIGLGSMLGAGVFSAVGPAARVAGAALLYSLVVAGVVAYCNATSSAQLASVYPASGGTYVYGRERLGRVWGFLAGWSFVVGKLASLAAMALTFGTYVYSPLARPLGIVAVVAVTAVNYRGVTRTAALTRAIVAIVVASLLMIVLGSLLDGSLEVGRLKGDLVNPPPGGLLQAAGLLFFSFAGYARIATLGEEVVDPARTIPRAIPIALGIVLILYVSVYSAALLAVGPESLADSTAPLAAAVSSGPLAGLAAGVRTGAAVASLGVLLSLMAGVSRTAFAMAANGELPRGLASVHPRFRVPHRAEVVVAVIVSVLAATLDLRSAIGFSSFAVLFYYALTNASAWTLSKAQRRWPRLISIAGFTGCIVLALSLPGASVIGGIVVLGCGLAAFAFLLRGGG